MNQFRSFIIRRYLFSKGRLRAVHWVSLVATVAIAVIVTASVVVLSVFNGYGDILIDGSSPFDADLLIKPSKGQFVSLEDESIKKSLEHDAIAWIAPFVYGEGMLTSKGTFLPAKLIGVPYGYTEQNGLKKLLYKGSLKAEGTATTLGSELYMALALPEEGDTLTLVLPHRTRKINPLLPYASLINRDLHVAGVIHSNNERYNHTLFLSIDTLRACLQLSPNTSSAIGIYLRTAYLPRIKSFQKELQQKLGKEYTIQNRHQQQPELTKLVSIEKWFTYCILAFIMFLAGFNVICSSTLILIEKRRDRFLFHALGASSSTIRKIFIGHSLAISLIGATIGIILGILLCLLQQQFGFATFSIGSNEVAYPVKLFASDLLPIFALVSLLSFIAAWLPARLLIKSHLSIAPLS